MSRSSRSSGVVGSTRFERASVGAQLRVVASSRGGRDIGQLAVVVVEAERHGVRGPHVEDVIEDARRDPCERLPRRSVSGRGLRRRRASGETDEEQAHRGAAWRPPRVRLCRSDQPNSQGSGCRVFEAGTPNTIDRVSAKARTPEPRERLVEQARAWSTEAISGVVTVRGAATTSAHRRTRTRRACDFARIVAGAWLAMRGAMNLATSPSIWILSTLAATLGFWTCFGACVDAPMPPPSAAGARPRGVGSAGVRRSASRGRRARGRRRRAALGLGTVHGRRPHDRCASLRDLSRPDLRVGARRQRASVRGREPDRRSADRALGSATPK